MIVSCCGSLHNSSSLPLGKASWRCLHFRAPNSHTRWLLPDNVSASVLGIDDPSDEAFARDEKRKAAGYATEYTGIMNIAGYEAAVERHKYSVNHRDSFEEPFVIAQDGYVSSYSNCQDVTKISPGGYTNGAANGGYGHGFPHGNCNCP